tara:strand:+ start:72 stop:242 length:171 start_codon:yes stop_codon:yes gene_type:complete
VSSDVVFPLKNFTTDFQLNIAIAPLLVILNEKKQIIQMQAAIIAYSIIFIYDIKKY